MNIWIKTIAVLEIIGGVVGILYCPYLIFTGNMDPTSLLIIALFFGIYLLSLLAGIYLWKGSTFGRKASIAIQLLQLPKFVSPALIFMFSFGFDFFLHLTLANGFSTFGVQFRFLADSQLYFAKEGAPIVLGISVPAVFALVKLHIYDPAESLDVAVADTEPPTPDKYQDL